MNPRRHPVALSLGIISLVVIAWMILGLRGGGENSFARAYRVGTKIDWSRRDYQRIAWLSTNEALVYRHPDFFRLNLDTGQEKSFIMSLKPPVFRPWSLVNWYGLASPDGRYVLLSIWCDRDKRSSFCVRLADGHATALPSARIPRSAWLPDSSGWISVITNAAGSPMVERFDLSGTAIERNDLSVTGRHSYLSITSDGRVFPAQMQTNSSNTVLESFQLNLADLKLSREPFRIRPPVRAEWGIVELSPHGDRFMLTEIYHRLYPEIRFENEFPYLSPRFPEALRVWAGTVDGRHWRKVFDSHEVYDANAFDQLGIGGGWWFADGRSMCFRHGSNLWVRPLGLPDDFGK